MSATVLALTGGPCGGKTTAIDFISEKLNDRGFRTFVIPEVATMYINPGIPDIGKIASEDHSRYLEIQKEFIHTQLALFERAQAMAGVFKGEKQVILCDREIPDMLSYIPNEYVDTVLNNIGLKMADVFDRFDGAIHLVTAAIGAEKYYTSENNKARRESIEEAIIADERTRRAWIGCEHLSIIDNSTDFEIKMRRTLRAVTRVLGIPVPLEIERKFLLNSMPNLEDLGAYREIEIEQMYLLPSGGSGSEELRIRKRSQWGSSVYYRTRKKNVRPGVRQENSERITAQGYVDAQVLRDLSKRVIKKSRYCFIYENQYFELDVFIEPINNLYLLEIELTEENDEVKLPPFLDVKEEVTDDKKYSNYFIASN